MSMRAALAALLLFASAWSIADAGSVERSTTIDGADRGVPLLVRSRMVEGHTTFDEIHTLPEDNP